MLSGKRIVLGVTGSIAAYKAVEIVRRLTKLAAEVRVILTSGAQQFVTPLTFKTLTKNTVIADMFSPHQSLPLAHISLAEWCSLLLVAPATANIIGKFAHGIADDFLSTFFLSVNSKVLIAPAMNERMYHHPQMQQNMQGLQSPTVKFILPEHGELASAQLGVGRLANLDTIVQQVIATILPAATLPLSGKTVLITAAATREWLDAVRFISSPASGKMGYALAKVAQQHGARVILISGPTLLAPPAGVTLVRVTTAAEMRESVLNYFDQTDVVVMAAAVADYSPTTSIKGKMKKTGVGLTLSLSPTPDILAELGRKKGNKLLIGFAAETEDLIVNATTKLKQKQLDLIVANDISQPGAGFESDTNIVKIIDNKGKVSSPPLLPKEKLAEIIWERIIRLPASEDGESK